ncbi:MAG: sigma-54 dependent transcriptional regulator [Pseudomonadota bacterium]
MKSILVISKAPEVFPIIRGCFSSGHKMDKAANKNAGLELLQKKRYELIFIDLEMLQGSARGNDYKESLQQFWNLYPTLELIVMSPQEMIRDAVMALKAGASNYITYPVNPEEVKYVTEHLHESIIAQSELDYLRAQFLETDYLKIIQTKNPQMKIVYDKIRSVALTRSTVLLLGETGTGKSVLARLIHHLSSRRDAQFISVHCGAIPDTLLESELFGHEKGAFTGAVKRKLGKFEIATGGTIFLDEVGTITPSAQIKLLEVLQDGTFQRVGGEETLQANVRIIAAANVDLEKMCDEGRFRKDLYYRLNVFPIEIPPLKERIEDLPYFVDVFLTKMNKYNSKQIDKVDPQVVKSFRNYPWPGNIRELENILERAYILETTTTLSSESFPNELLETGPLLECSAVDPSLTLSEVRRKGVEEIEKRYLKELLAKNRGKIRESADSAGITTRQLHKLMTKYKIHKEEFKASPFLSNKPAH